ncbi:winged helix DNA-binding domain-containing protein [Amycolatopsis sp. 195334CR]|uniref:winged helix DNA-binding domain-containing protein n=1 Tax=Amycolatopsis sp. 195334CR TaxID=2814588 RepID=UPI001A8FA535|nr:winged helix DNA-binding domain-containing protein [Amycolatopsis sp. 195334CR]MBN6038744.1 AlkZ family DNA glycosylase [Amycolatopsis sp. 195334CR]
MTDVPFARAHAQLLAGPRGGDVAEVVRKVVALQAQDIRANRLGVRVRSAGLTASDVDAACASGAVVRTWAMRGTLHMLAAEDVAWIVGLLGPRFAAAGRPRRLQLGLDDETTARGVAALRSIVAGRSLPRGEIVAELASHGVVLDPKSQAPAHLLAFAALTGVLCRGGDDGDEPTYALFSDWVGPFETLPEEEALARLAARYLAAYAPATAEDFAAWSGLTLRQARAGFAAIDPVEAPIVDELSVRLLGHFDTYLLGYRSRELAVPAEHDRRVQSGGGFIMPVVLVNGRAVGTWRQERKKGTLAVRVEPFGELPGGLGDALLAEVEDLGRFLGIPAHFHSAG